MSQVRNLSRLLTRPTATRPPDLRSQPPVDVTIPVPARYASFVTPSDAAKKPAPLALRAELPPELVDMPDEPAVAVDDETMERWLRGESVPWLDDLGK